MAVKFSDFSVGTLGTDLEIVGYDLVTPQNVRVSYSDLKTDILGDAGTVTSIATSGPITGGTITDSGTIGITKSSASDDGYLSSADWITFNGKQAALNGTGFVKANGTAISYDNNTYYLASNPSGFTSNLGTVTSVATSGPITGGTITGSGTIGITQSTTSTDGYLSSTDWNTFNNKQSASSITANRQTSSYQIALTDVGKLVEMNVASANTLTVPLNSTIPFPIGSIVNVSQYGAGATTITPVSGVTIRSLSSYLKLAGQYVAVSLVKIATDEWYCFGNTIA